jgi:1,4-alpha-glucan branching enzyme
MNIYDHDLQVAAAEQSEMQDTVRHDVTRLTTMDLYLFNEGTHVNLHDKLGSHLMTLDGRAGAYFAVWAPNARSVSVIGDFNEWNPDRHALRPREVSGIWEGFIPGVKQGSIYKYHIRSKASQYTVDKTDPYGVYHEVPPAQASIVWPLDYEWHDGEWMSRRGECIKVTSPISIYEMHLGSWRRVVEEDGRPLSYREAAHALAEYVSGLGYTHVEFLPLMEHPFSGSWGYQTTGYFAPTSRYGTPQDFMYLVDVLHQHGIGVILDWVPSHFPSDEHGLAYFDGTQLYEHADIRKGLHPDWKSLIFNYGRHEVRCFLGSSALFWLEKYHIDGLRVDAVASMLYLDYSRKEGEWIPNEHGGRENLEAIQFLRWLNAEVYARHPDVQMIAEESTAWPMVSRPTYVGGLGFGLKWDMGWMHDMLEYVRRDPIYRTYHHNLLTFRMLYAYNENFVLPLSHDEVVHGKGSLLDKMPGDDWRKFANLRLLYAYMYAQPGKKLLFMGCEFGQWREWIHDESLDWHLLSSERHLGVQRLLTDLNRLYRAEPALHLGDCEPGGFEWIDGSDAQQSVVSFLRKVPGSDEFILAVFNFTPVPRIDYRVGVPRWGVWRECLNSDAADYGGSGMGNYGEVTSVPISWHGRPHSVSLSLPPLAGVLFKAAGLGA